MEAKQANMLTFVGGNTQFLIPIYQRTYSWTEKQCKQLWSDIQRAALDDSMPSHFLGSIVYIHEGVLHTSSVPQFVVIDGQQRLTTLTLLLAAFNQYMQEGHLATAINTKQLTNYYLVNSNEEGDLRHKLVLTQNDRDTLIRLVEGKSVPPAVSERVMENYKFFKDQIQQSELTPDELWKGISKLLVVDIALERGKDNPQLIFESLNSTGLDLSETDKIRNYVLMDLPPTQQKTIYDEYWYPMEQMFDPRSPQQFDGFVRDYLTVKTGRIPNIYEIYPTFKSYVEQRRSAGASIKESVADLHKYSLYYVQMARLKEEDKQLRAAFEDLNNFKVWVAYPFLLEVYDDYKQSLLTRDEFVKVVRLVENYAFRRSICGIPTNSLNKTFLTLGREVEELGKGRYLESVGLAFLLKDAYARFPSDVEFKEHFVRRDVYNSLRIKYLLGKLENYKRKETASVDNYTIEHIMPQNPKLAPAWQADLGADWQTVQQTYLHTIGNLTLTGYNSSLSDRPFLEKRDDEKGGFKHSPLRLNEKLGQLDHWNEKTILERAHKLASKAVEIWSAPEVPADVVAKHRLKKPYLVPAPHKAEVRDYYVALSQGEHRTWDDCLRYGFISAGHGTKYSKPLEQLSVGSRVFVHVPTKGYTGVGSVLEGPVRVSDFKVRLDGVDVPILSAPLKATNMGDDADDPEMSEYVVKVNWLKTKPLENAVWEKGMFANQNIVCPLKDNDTLGKLIKEFELKAKLDPRPAKQWTEESFFRQLAKLHSADTVDVARSIWEWAERRVTKTWWGHGSIMGSYVPILIHKGVKHQLFAVWTSGTFEVYFYHYQKKPPFHKAEKRLELLRKLNAIKGVSIPEAAVTKRPNIELDVFTNPEALKQLLAVLDWMVDEIRAT